jgi:hypothetical protein
MIKYKLTQGKYSDWIGISAAILTLLVANVSSEVMPFLRIKKVKNKYLRIKLALKVKIKSLKKFFSKVIDEYNELAEKVFVQNELTLEVLFILRETKCFFK